LSLRAVVDDEIQCGYHGLKFDSCGTCTWAPQEHIPLRADIGVYPLIETGPWLWVWIGEAAEVRLAAEAQPREISLKIDTGALAARRLIARRLTAQ
jgi:phenylpropionate dioxygenase-like ring-hydroxylating dioxygenase large terminal subunit